MNLRRLTLNRGHAVLVSLLALSACATADVNDYCEYSRTELIRALDPEYLALVLGAEPDEALHDPLVLFSRPAGDGIRESVAAKAIAAAHPLPGNIDESYCADVDWSTYSLEFDDDAWQAFWQPEKGRTFELAVTFPNMKEPQKLRKERFGFALLDTHTSQYLVACGCYWR